jgi:UrcA family protein
MTRTFFAAAIFTLGTIAAAQAAAPKAIVVAYGDLNLSTAAGQSELKIRLQNAAGSLCSPVLPGPDYRGSEQSALEDTSVYHACIGRLTDRAMTKIKTGRN